jgi:hypothetical protein
MRAKGLAFRKEPGDGQDRPRLAREGPPRSSSGPADAWDFARLFDYFWHSADVPGMPSGKKRTMGRPAGMHKVRESKAAATPNRLHILRLGEPQHYRPAEPFGHLCPRPVTRQGALMMRKRHMSTTGLERPLTRPTHDLWNEFLFGDMLWRNAPGRFGRAQQHRTPQEKRNEPKSLKYCNDLIFARCASALCGGFARVQIRSGEGVRGPARVS